ncbi:helix-turn-helix domain-containing protein [uncultured Bacteroides sp.]|uniref:AlbA family DNA-binding domain-containing protein n=1 Tax=uncultured Bacteroides sp. TaxID=162156 RepID=UPI0025E792AC|nr:ATP-binding protein [uncultured Bacteroides sp.]
MLLTFEEIISLTVLKESNTLELKETTGQLTRGMESDCAFMNSINGGYLLFGVYDKGKIIKTERERK